MNFSRLLRMTMAVLVGFGAGLPIQVHADDTEIYLGNDSITEGVRPNVMFILDTSGSMSAYDGESKDRLGRMKEALDSILDEANNINVGLMRFTNPGGPVLFPVADISADASEVESGASAGQPDVTVNIVNADDDAEELAGEMLLDSLLLDLMEVSSFGNESNTLLQIVTGSDDAEQSPLFMNNSSSIIEMTDNSAGNRTDGFRFQGVLLPQGAEILRANLSFLSYSSTSGTTDLTFFGHLAVDSPTFPSSAGTNDPFDRLDELTTASVDWNGVQAWSDSNWYDTPQYRHYRPRDS